MTIPAPIPELRAGHPDQGVPSACEDRIPPPLREAMRRQGFTELTAVQRAVLETLADGRDLLISSQTGSGKTVALGISMAHELIAAGPSRRGTGPSVLVITPTRELAMQVQRELGWLYAGVAGISVTVVTGGTSILNERRQLQRGPRIVVGTPGRMLDHIRNRALDCAQVTEVVLDEADQMLDMGFREELEGIIDVTPSTRRTHLVSATFPPGILKLAERFQRDPVHIEGTRLGEANQDIEHVAHVVREEDRYAALVNLLLLTGEQRTLVFVNTRAAAAEIAQSLFSDGFAAMPLSGELAQAQRTRTLDAFRTGSVKVLVATDVAARGLDIPDVATVVHAGPPEDADAYVHRSGRTGRAGRKGRCVMLVTPRSRRFVERVLNETRIEVDWREVPTAEVVRRQLAGEERQRLAAAIDGSQGVGLEQVAQAEELLAQRDPVEVIAALLATIRPKGVREPMELQPVHSRDGREKPRFERSSFEKSRNKQGFGKPGPGRTGQRSRGGEFTRFQVNWGFRNGANPSRLVATICRRGDVSSKLIGTIDIDSHRSTFEIASNAARDFEKKAKRPDTRDPKMWIKRLVGGPRQLN
jgi:ATP-dependent RNA helicase DeaD